MPSKISYQYHPGEIYTLNEDGIDSASTSDAYLIIENIDQSEFLRVLSANKTINSADRTITLTNEQLNDSTIQNDLHINLESNRKIKRHQLGHPIANVSSKTLEEIIRELILLNVPAFAATKESNNNFLANSIIPPSGKVIGSTEFTNMISAVLDGWLTTGRFNSEFESKLSEYLGIKYLLTCNSGSSANLLAISALTSSLLGDRALKPGDEVITAAAGFPTTVNPIIQNSLIPVFVDSHIPSYNPLPESIEAAITEKTKAIVLAHTLGNPFAAREIREIADRHGLWLVEDCCDALGSNYQGQKVGTFGHLATLSFYPAHHITMGEGGAVFTNDPLLKRIVESFRDWGRDCWCNPGCDNTCGRRFDWQLGDLPEGYDHKYIYSHVGFNLKITDMQAACGLAQLGRLDDFISKRKNNFEFLKSALAGLKNSLILPEKTNNSDPSWFGFPVTLSDTASFSRVDLLRYLNQKNIGSRLLFAGNLTKQPSMLNRNYRISGTLENADKIMKDTFWVGCWPGLGQSELSTIATSIRNFCEPNF